MLNSSIQSMQSYVSCCTYLQGRGLLYLSPAAHNVLTSGVWVVVVLRARGGGGNACTGNPDDWEQIYNEDFMPPGLTKDEEKNVLGGATGK